MRRFSRRLDGRPVDRVTRNPVLFFFFFFLVRLLIGKLSRGPDDVAPNDSTAGKIAPDRVVWCMMRSISRIYGGFSIRAQKSFSRRYATSRSTPLVRRSSTSREEFPKEILPARDECRAVLESEGFSLVADRAIPDSPCPRFVKENRAPRSKIDRWFPSCTILQQCALPDRRYAYDTYVSRFR